MLKGGMLLAVLGARRPTADVDALARNMASDEQAVLDRIVEIAAIPIPADGVVFAVETARAQQIREESLYAGTRVRMDAHLAAARIRFSMDVNFGDPVTPGPVDIELRSLRPGIEPIRILGYPIETVIAEKLSTAIALGAANTRVRDYADLWMLIQDHTLQRGPVHRALSETASFRSTSIEPLSAAVGSMAADRAGAFATYRTRLGPDGARLPASFTQVVADVVAFADPLAADADAGATWNAALQEWS